MQFKDSTKNRRSYGMLAVVCLLLQLAIVPNIGFGNGRANMALVFAAIVALQTGGSTAVICGFLAGLVFDLSTTGPIGLMAFLLTIGSYMLGTEGRNLLSEGFNTSMVAFSGFATVVSLFYHIAMLLVGDASGILDVVVFRTIPTTILTILAFAPFAWFISQSTGSPLQLGRKSSRSGRGRGSRYDLGDV